MFHTDVIAPINHAIGKRCRKVFLPGNHEARLQKFLMAHPELFSLRDLELRNDSMSTITGHVHRSGTFKTKVGNDVEDRARVTVFVYAHTGVHENPDWQQGITLFTVTDKICRIYPVEFSGQFAQFAKRQFKA
jgi:hypothetical protein